MILIIILLMTISVALHELGHVLAAKIVGWKFHGVKFSLSGIYTIIEQNDNEPYHIWKVASAGLIVNLLLAAIFIWLSLYFPILYLIAIFNIILFLINIIPFKGTDGEKIFNHIKQLKIFKI